MSATRDDQRGSVLIIAVIAMLVLGILSVSFALLARVEVAIGVNYKAQAQAEALAEAGLERGRDAVRTANAETCGFTRWTDAELGARYDLRLGARIGALHWDRRSGRAVTRSSSTTTALPSCLRRSRTRAAPGRRLPSDTNETAVLTAWATTASGQGRSRVRAILGDRQPLEARLLELDARTTRRATATRRRTGTGTPASPRRTRTTRTGPRPTTCCRRRRSGARRSIRRSTATLPFLLHAIPPSQGW